MQRFPTDSGMLRSAGYDPETGTLELEFNGGRVYRYRDVPEFVYRALLRAESKHDFFTRVIDGRYPFSKDLL